MKLKKTRKYHNKKRVLKWFERLNTKINNCKPPKKRNQYSTKYATQKDTKKQLFAYTEKPFLVPTKELDLTL